MLTRSFLKVDSAVTLLLDGCIVWNAHNTVFDSKRSVICAQAVYILHSTRPNVTWLHNRWWLAACDWVMSALSAVLSTRIRRVRKIWEYVHPAWGRGTPFPPLLLPCPFPFSSFTLYYFSSFPFLIHFTYFLVLSIRSLSTRIVPLRFQARGRRRRSNLGLVCFCVMIMLSVLLS